MSRSFRYNTQLFALPQPPPARLEIGGSFYRLVRVFKHDFFAATCLYEVETSASEIAAPPRALPATLRSSPLAPRPSPLLRLVVKFGREQSFCGLPMAWFGELHCTHEEGIYRRLAGVPGIPRWAGRVGSCGYAIEYIEALPLDHFTAPPPGFFDRLRELFDAVHARGVAYGDANKRSNILVAPDGRPYLVDFQLSLCTRDEWPLVDSLVGAIVRYIARKDLYHLYKHKRRMAPQELTAEQEVLSRRRGALHSLHRKISKPYRTLRRRFLARRYSSGKLVSPTAQLEDHHQPEKDFWREP